jgi:L-methionine (R)-S-oxide reductase
VFTESPVDRSSVSSFYIDLARQTRHLLEGERDAIANLSNVSALLNLHMLDINWVGFYLWHSSRDELVLGPFQGKPACVRIAYGRGVCGTAAARREPLVVPDVHAFPGHIACDPESRSEIVLPMLKDGRLVGVLDIDSPRLGRFSEEDAMGLQQVLDVVLAGSDFPDW